MEYHLEREQWIPSSVEHVFGFFGDAQNLAEITPPWLSFRIHPPLPDAMREDVRLAYTIRLAGIPIRWRTRIARWDPPHRFVDIQERGPYTLWEHHHEFRAIPEDGSGVLMRDRVRYRMPLGPLGRVAHSLFVRAALATIFDYRADRIRDRFGGAFFETPEIDGPAIDRRGSHE